MKDITVELNVQEMGIIISALQNLDNSDELRLSHEYGSVSALYNRLYPQWEQMDRSETGIRNDVVPSF